MIMLKNMQVNIYMYHANSISSGKVENICARNDTRTIRFKNLFDLIDDHKTSKPSILWSCPL